MTRQLGIRIEGIEVFAFHGVLPEERAQGQDFRIDVELAPVSDRACDTDALEDAVDYGAVTERVVAIATGDPVDLIERLADLIAADLLDAFPVERVTVAVHKPHAPIAAPFGDVVVTVTRSA
ncbi:MAG: dihydroneopterin aldolase [Gaiellales bacterium]